MPISAPRDQNHVPTIMGVSSVDGITPVLIYVDPTTHRVLVDMSGIEDHFQTDIFTSTNNQTTFTASTTVVSDFFVAVNGSIQTPSADYTVSGSNLVLTNGIPAGNVVVWKYIK